MYKIKVEYRTGNSFGSEDTEESLDLEWQDLKIAKENLKAIKEHYEMYNKIESCRNWKNNNSPQDILKEHSDRWWFVSKKDRFFVKFKDEFRIIDNTKENIRKYKDHETQMRYDINMCQNCMKLKADNGNLMQQWNFWCGYFESLHGAEIVTSQDNDMSFSI